MTPDALPVLYVGSWSRSGSTLLDLILGRVPGFVSVGELRYLWDRGLVEGQLCGCGVAVPECPFWRAVLDQAFGGADRMDPGAALALRERVDGLARLPWLTGPWRPPGFARDLHGFRELLARLYRAVRAVSGATVIVDSSKYAAYGLILAGVPEVDLRLFHLVRDSRAVAYSWTRRKRLPEIPGAERAMPVFPPARSAVFWALENLALDRLRAAVPRAALLRYDDLTDRPEPVLMSALSRVGLPAELGFLASGRLDPAPNHTVAGNPLRFERGAITVRPDVEWRAGLAPGARRLVTALTWPLLLRYGFPLRPRA